MPDCNSFELSESQLTFRRSTQQNAVFIFQSHPGLLFRQLDLHCHQVCIQLDQRMGELTQAQKQGRKLRHELATCGLNPMPGSLVARCRSLIACTDMPAHVEGD